MSLLNQLFNRGIFGSKCKTCLSLAVSRIKLVQNKRDLQLRHMCKEIAQFLLAGQEAIARIRVEHVIREQNLRSAFDILELFCEFVTARVPIIENEKECPVEMREAIASIIYAAPKCVDVPELLHLKAVFATKYTKEFIMAASELRPDSAVNRDLIQKLSVDAPSPESRLKALKKIAMDYNVEWNSAMTEAELFKTHEDLLSVSKMAVVEDEKSGAALNSGKRRATEEGEGSMRGQWSEGEVVRASDVLEEARAAVAHADRAVLMARSAAQLANFDANSLHLGPPSSY